MSLTITPSPAPSYNPTHSGLLAPAGALRRPVRVSGRAGPEGGEVRSSARGPPADAPLLGRGQRHRVQARALAAHAGVPRGEGRGGPAVHLEEDARERRGDGRGQAQRRDGASETAQHQGAGPAGPDQGRVALARRRQG